MKYKPPSLKAAFRHVCDGLPVDYNNFVVHRPRTFHRTEFHPVLGLNIKWGNGAVGSGAGRWVLRGGMLCLKEEHAWGYVLRKRL